MCTVRLVQQMPAAPIQLLWHARVRRDESNRWLREVVMDLFADSAMPARKANPAQKSGSSKQDVWSRGLVESVERGYGRIRRQELSLRSTVGRIFGGRLRIASGR